MPPAFATDFSSHFELCCSPGRIFRPFFCPANTASEQTVPGDIFAVKALFTGFRNTPVKILPCLPAGTGSFICVMVFFGSVFSGGIPGMFYRGVF